MTSSTDTVLILRGAGHAHDARRGVGRIEVRGRRADVRASIPRLEVERLDAANLAELRRDPEVSAASLIMPTRLIRPLAAGPAATQGETTWGVEAIGATRSPYAGNGVTVAVLDTGIDSSHPAFRGVTTVERDFSGAGPEDTAGHGTHCAGTILGRDVEGIRIGVAPGVEKMLAGKVLDGDGDGTTRMLFDGLLWAMAEGAQVVSLSVGLDFPGMVRGLTAGGWPLELATSRALEAYGGTQRMLERLTATLGASPLGKGTVVVAASGNESRRDRNPDHALAASLPAAAEGIISVGAVTRDGGAFEIGPFSNVPLLCAPGVGILSAEPGGGLVTLTGTSMACPHVAGAAALWWEALPEQGHPVTAELVVAKLLGTARPDVFVPGTPVADRGAGLVSAP